MMAPGSAPAGARPVSPVRRRRRGAARARRRADRAPAGTRERRREAAVRPGAPPPGETISSGAAPMPAKRCRARASTAHSTAATPATRTASAQATPWSAGSQKVACALMPLLSQPGPFQMQRNSALLRNWNGPDAERSQAGSPTVQTGERRARPAVRSAAMSAPPVPACPSRRLPARRQGGRGDRGVERAGRPLRPHPARRRARRWSWRPAGRSAWRRWWPTCRARSPSPPTSAMRPSASG